MNVSAIITAAGLGKRMGTETPKQFLKIWDRPILLHTLDNFESSQYVDFIAIVAAAMWVNETRQLVESMELSKEWVVVEGGAKRQDSVAIGIATVPEDSDIIVVHDGVRPFIEPSIIDKSVEKAVEFGGCVVAVPVKDTVKTSREGDFIKETIDRSTLWSAQTPQTFRAEILRRAMAEAKRSNFYGTDEASLVERIGENIKLLMGSYRNIKITTPEDLDIAEAISGG